MFSKLKSLFQSHPTLSGDPVPWQSYYDLPASKVKEYSKAIIKYNSNVNMRQNDDSIRIYFFPERGTRLCCFTATKQDNNKWLVRALDGLI